MLYKVFDKKKSGSIVKNKNMSNQELTEELHKSIVRKFEKRKINSSFIDNIWDADFADMKSLSKFNIWIRFLLCVIDIYSTHVWIIPLKDKNVSTITNTFPKILDESNWKSNKKSIDKGSEFFNKSGKLWL